MKTVAITSFKGGTAKTSIVLHIGAALSQFHKKKILLIDFDAQANLTAGLGFDPDEHESLAAVLQGKKTLQEVILKTDIKGLDLLPADTWLERVEVSGTLAGDRYSHERLKNILKDLVTIHEPAESLRKSHADKVGVDSHHRKAINQKDGLPQQLQDFAYDYVFIDTPPSLCWLTESALIAAQHTLIAATPEFYSVKGLERLSQFIESISERHPLNVLGVALSFWNTRGKNNPAFMDLIEKTFPQKVLSTKIRRDISVSEAAIFGKPVFDSAPTCRAAEDFLSLTKEVLDCLHPLEKSVSRPKKGNTPSKKRELIGV